jgi:hypothetical protein
VPVLGGVCAVVTLWGSDLTDLLKGSRGTASSGPGQGAGGVLILDIPGDAASSTLGALAENIANLTGTVSDLSANGTQSHVGLTNEFLKGIGQPASGIKTEPYSLTFDPALLEGRAMLLRQLQASPDAARYQALILYLQASTANDARMLAYGSRLNTLIKVNESPLNYQQRVRLAAEMGLLQGQLTIADQEMRDVSNRAVVSGSLQRMQDAFKELNAKARAGQIDGMLGAP